MAIPTGIKLLRSEISYYIMVMTNLRMRDTALGHIDSCIESVVVVLIATRIGCTSDGVVVLHQS